MSADFPRAFIVAIMARTPSEAAESGFPPGHRAAHLFRASSARPRPASPASLRPLCSDFSRAPQCSARARTRPAPLGPPQPQPISRDAPARRTTSRHRREKCRRCRACYSFFVMRGLDPRIHQKNKSSFRAMDCRVKPGNDAALAPLKPAHQPQSVMRRSYSELFPFRRCGHSGRSTVVAERGAQHPGLGRDIRSPRARSSAARGQSLP